MKLHIPLIPLTLALALTGCGTTTNTKPFTPIIVREAVMLGASFGLEQHPEAAPYVAAATPIICASAENIILNPADVVASIQSANIPLDPQGVLIVNGAVAVYDALWAAYGGDTPTTMQPYLQAVCDGLRDAVITPPTTRRNLPNRPHLHK